MLLHKRRKTDDASIKLKDKKDEPGQLKISDIASIEKAEYDDTSKKTNTIGGTINDSMKSAAHQQMTIEHQQMSIDQSATFGDIVGSAHPPVSGHISVNPTMSSMQTSGDRVDSKRVSNIPNAPGFSSVLPVTIAQSGQMPMYTASQLPASYVINIHQSSDKDSLIVETNYQQKKFLFYDRNRNFMGGFSVTEFIRYVTSNVSSNFLTGVDCDSTRPIIEKYICNIKYIERPSKRYIINMLNYFESPFMGNIETLIKFYTFIHEFEEKNLEQELSKLEEKELSKVREIFNSLIYTLLNHILKIIAALTNKLTGTDAQSVKIRESLLNYSVAIVYRLTKFIKTEIDVKVDELNYLNQDLLRIEAVRTELITKLDSVQRAVDKQNAEIDIVLRNVMMYQQMKHRDKQISEIVTDTDNDVSSVVNTSSASSIASVTSESTVHTSEHSLPFLGTLDPASLARRADSEHESAASDKHAIFNPDTESGRRSRQMDPSHNSSLRVSELLSEINHLRDVVDKNSKSDTQKNNAIRVSEKHRSSNPSRNMESVFSTGVKSDRSSRQDNSVSSVQRLSTEKANTLFDLLDMHSKVDFSTESENSFQTDELGAEGNTFKHLSSPSTEQSVTMTSNQSGGRSSTRSDSQKHSNKSRHRYGSKTKSK